MELSSISNTDSLSRLPLTSQLQEVPAPDELALLIAWALAIWACYNYPDKDYELQR